MKTLSMIRESIIESVDIIIPRGKYHIPRYQMPQIPKEYYQELFHLLHLRDIEVHKIQIPAKFLLVAQNEIDRKKVRAWMVSMPKGAKNKPCIVSIDNYILDGNHTVLALLNRNKNCSIDCFQVNLELEQVLNTIKLFDKVSYKTINEQSGIINTLKRE